ncbi:UDP-glycosyltransferase 83A1 [Linum perenne]
MATKQRSRVLLLPNPEQGHVFPMMKLAHKLTHHGIDVTVATLEFIHQKIIIPQQKKTEQKKTEQLQSHGGIKLVSLGGIGSDSDLSDPVILTESVEKELPIQLRELLQSQQEEQFSCVIADAFLAGAFAVTKEFGIKLAALWTASMENLALTLRIPQLVDSGIIDENGFLLNKDQLSISICDEIPAWKRNELTWSCRIDQLQYFLFKHAYLKPSQYLSLFDCVILNSFHELEPSAFQLYPNFLPIGPLVTNSHDSNLPGSFWSPDRTCLAWLDKHPPKSVIYVAFGSIVFFPQQQFEELATGLEMTGRPFLWVVRTNFVEGSGQEFLDGFLERVANRGKIVEWTNQEEVLSHPSTGCFMSHCGWNSTLDGVWSGVPFLCWPYFADQFHNRDSICESWKVGLKVDAEDETGLITRSEIANKVEQLFNDETVKGNAIRLRETAIKSVNEGGSSYHNLLSFINNL